jgi:hypothetical protein
LWYESVASVDAVSDAFTSWFLEITPLPQISKHVFPFASLQPSADAMATVLA